MLNINVLFFCLIWIKIASSPIVEVDSIINNTKKERNLHFTRRQIPPNRQILKNTAKDVTYTQFAVIDDDNLSVAGQITKGGGGNYYIVV